MLRVLLFIAIGLASMLCFFTAGSALLFVLYMLVYNFGLWTLLVIPLLIVAYGIGLYIMER